MCEKYPTGKGKRLLVQFPTENWNIPSSEHAK
jgi:hypothetical protein